MRHIGCYQRIQGITKYWKSKEQEAFAVFNLRKRLRRFAFNSNSRYNQKC